MLLTHVALSQPPFLISQRNELLWTSDLQSYLKNMSGKPPLPNFPDLQFGSFNSKFSCLPLARAHLEICKKCF